MIQHPTILLADEDAGDEALALRVLTKYHIWNEVAVVRNGTDAWEYLSATGKYVGREPGKIPQVVLLGSNLSRIGAVELVRRMRALPATRRIPVVLLASSKEEEDALRAQGLEHTMPISKPLGFFKLLEALQKLGVYWLVLSEPPST